MLKFKNDEKKKGDSGQASIMDDLVSVSTNTTNASRPPSIITNLNEFTSQFVKKPSKSLNSAASSTPRVSINQTSEKIDPSSSIFINFRKPPPIFSLIHKYMDENLDRKSTRLNSSH